MSKNTVNQQMLGVANAANGGMLKENIVKKRIFHYMKFDLMKKSHQLFLKLSRIYSLMQIPCQVYNLMLRNMILYKGVTIIPQGSRFTVKLRIPKRCAPENREMI